MTRPQTKWTIEAYFIVPAAYQSAVNAKFEGYGLGPDNFSVGLSTSGDPPAQAETPFGLAHAEAPAHLMSAAGATMENRVLG